MPDGHQSDRFDGKQIQTRWQAIPADTELRFLVTPPPLPCTNGRQMLKVVGAGTLLTVPLVQCRLRQRPPA